MEWRERPPEELPGWLVRLRAKLSVHMGWWTKPWFTTYPDKADEEEARGKTELLYNKMMEDIQASDVDEDIKKGLDPVPAFIGYLLAAAGGAGLSMILASLMTPYIQAKLTYPLNRQAAPYRLPPDVVFKLAWKLHKGEEIPEELLGHLKDQGWGATTIDDGLEASKVMPTPQDIVNFLAHEVFEPDMVDKYSLESEWSGLDKETAKKIGMDEETLRLYWRNHWQHPGLSSVYRMLHRDLINPEDMKEYYRLVEIPEYWRDKLTELSWDVPNRIETRMMARYLDLPKVEVEKMLQYAGLKEEFRSDAADFMIIMGLQGYWSKLYRNGWLTSEGLQAEIEAKGLSPVTADRVYKYIVKAEKPERVSESRTLTRSLIIKGLKQEKLTAGQTVELLMEHQNYDRAEAEYIVSVEVAAMGSPETYREYLSLVRSYRKSQGEEVAEIPQDLIDAEKAVRAASVLLRASRDKGEPSERLSQLTADLREAETRLAELERLHSL